MKCGVYIVALTLAWPGLAGAQQVDPAKTATAEALFREGRAYLEAGDVKEACAKLEESLRLDRAIGTMWHLGRCYEAQGKAASAWSMFLEVAAEARRLQRPRQEQAATERAQALEPKLCRLQVRVEATPLMEIKTFVDGRELARAGWGASVPVDCGKHVLEVRSEGAVEKVEVLVNTPGKLTPIDAPIPVKKKKRAGAIPKPKKKPSTPAWYGDTVGWSLVGAGVVSGVAAVFLLHRSNGYADDARAPGLDLRDRDRLFDDADNMRLWSLVAAGAGAALVAGGVVKLGIHDEKRSVIVTPTKGGASAFLEVTF